MRPRGAFRFVLALWAFSAFWSGCSRAQDYPQFTVPPPSRHDLQAGGDLQLTFTVLKSSAKLKGIRVYLDPPVNSPLTVESKGYQGSVYFSDDLDVKDRDRPTFVLPLKQPVTGAAHLLLVPLDDAGTSRGGLSILRARIAAPDNSAFR